MVSTEKKINEFCSVGKLDEYRDILKEIFERIEDQNCQICARYDESTSLHAFMPDKCIIRISLVKQYSNPIEIIWTILHEFGHHLSGEISKQDEGDREKSILREKLAWEFARTEVLKYPTLVEKLSNFDSYEIECLKSYIK